jgi:predicted AAA+ superfamily ATPase
VLLGRSPVVGIVGARQVGKTTLARDYASGLKTPVSFFDLENPEDLARLADPMLALKTLNGLVVIDEVQRLPEIFRVLRVLADRPGKPARFLILGSASPELLGQGSESLAGRVIFHELKGFSLVKSRLVNGEPWSVLKIAGFGRRSARRSASRPEAAPHNAIMAVIEPENT